MTITTNRLVLRNFTNEDLNDVFEYCSQAEVVEMAGWASLQSIEEAEKLLLNWIENPTQLAIVLKENNKVIGHIGINEDSEESRQDTKELGYALNPRYHKCGYMSEVILAVLTDLFKSDILYVWACCFQDNIASKHLIEKCGFIFQQVGTFHSSSLNKEFKTYEYRISKSEWLDISQ